MCVGCLFCSSCTKSWFLQPDEDEPAASTTANNASNARKDTQKVSIARISACCIFTCTLAFSEPDIWTNRRWACAWFDAYACFMHQNLSGLCQMCHLLNFGDELWASTQSRRDKRGDQGRAKLGRKRKNDDDDDDDDDDV